MELESEHGLIENLAVRPDTILFIFLFPKIMLERPKLSREWLFGDLFRVSWL